MQSNGSGKLLVMLGSDDQEGDTQISAMQVTIGNNAIVTNSKNSEINTNVTITVNGGLINRGKIKLSPLTEILNNTLPMTITGSLTNSGIIDLEVPEEIGDETVLKSMITLDGGTFTQYNSVDGDDEIASVHDGRKNVNIGEIETGSIDIYNYPGPDLYDYPTFSLTNGAIVKLLGGEVRHGVYTFGNIQGLDIPLSPADQIRIATSIIFGKNSLTGFSNQYTVTSGAVIIDDMQVPQALNVGYKLSYSPSAAGTIEGSYYPAESSPAVSESGKLRMTLLNARFDVEMTEIQLTFPLLVCTFSDSPVAQQP